MGAGILDVVFPVYRLPTRFKDIRITHHFPASYAFFTSSAIIFNPASTTGWSWE